MRDFEKWMALPKFKVKVIEMATHPKAIQITYGHHQTGDVVNSCFAYPESAEDLALQLEAALNSLMKIFYISPVENGNASSQRKESENS